MQKNLAIFGAGGHALVVGEIVQLECKYRIAGYLVDSYDDNSIINQLKDSVLGGLELLPHLSNQGTSHVIVAIGDCAARLRIAEIAECAGLALATAIHPSAIISPSAQIEEGAVIAAGAVVNPFTSIGKNVIINTAATVDHECTIEQGAHIAPGVHLAGSVFIGKGAWVGIGAAVLSGVHIGAGAIIGAGSVVLNDIPDGTIAYGVPARIRMPVVNVS